MSNPFGNAQKGELLKLDPAAANAVTPLRTYAAGEQPIGNAIDATSFLFTSETFHGPGNTATGGRIAKGTTAGAAGAANAFTADNAFYTPHDLAVSGINLFASDPNYLRPTSASNRIMRMVAAGVAPVAATVAKDLGAATHPNGIVATADGLTLYVATNGNASSLAAIRKFPINLDGTLGTEVGAPFIDVAAANGIDAEGLTIDDGGNLYLAVRKTAGPAVQVFRPAGTLIGEITLPATRGTHAHWVTFGGTDRQTLYISVGKNDGTGGGAVYTYRPGCTGPY